MTIGTNALLLDSKSLHFGERVVGSLLSLSERRSTLWTPPVRVLVRTTPVKCFCRLAWVDVLGVELR